MIPSHPLGEVAAATLGTSAGGIPTGNAAFVHSQSQDAKRKRRGKLLRENTVVNPDAGVLLRSNNRGKCTGGSLNRLSDPSSGRVRNAWPCGRKSVGTGSGRLPGCQVQDR